MRFGLTLTWIDHDDDHEVLEEFTIDSDDLGDVCKPGDCDFSEEIAREINLILRRARETAARIDRTEDTK
jgi:hypothetical protein